MVYCRKTVAHGSTVSLNRAQSLELLYLWAMKTHKHTWHLQSTIGDYCGWLSIHSNGNNNLQIRQSLVQGVCSREWSDVASAVVVRLELHPKRLKQILAVNREFCLFYMGWYLKGGHKRQCGKILSFKQCCRQQEDYTKNCSKSNGKKIMGTGHRQRRFGHISAMTVGCLWLVCWDFEFEHILSWFLR